MGKIEKTVNYGQLVEPEEFVPSGDEKDISVPVENEDDVEMIPGSMGVLVMPKRHAPVNEEARKHESGDDVEELLAAMNPFPWKASGGKAKKVPDDYEVVLEKFIRNIVQEVALDVLAEKSPPGTTKKQKEKMEAQKAAIEKSGTSKEKAANIVFGKAWKKYKNKKKNSK